MVKDRLVVKINIQQTVRIIINTLLVFFFIIELPLVGFLTTRRLSFLLASIYLVLHRVELKKVLSAINKKKVHIFILLNLICALIAFINTAFIPRNPSFTYLEPLYFIYEVLYIYVFALYCTVALDSLEIFGKVIINVFTIQSIAIIAAALNRNVNTYLFNTFYLGDRRFISTVANGSRVVGIGMAGAAGSVFFFGACFVLIMLSTENKISKSRFNFLYVFFMAATFFLGRTGLILELIMMIVYLVVQRKLSTKVLSVITVLGTIMIAFALYVKHAGDSSQYIVKWVSEGLSLNGVFNTSSTIRNMAVPHFSLKMLFGTGITFGETSQGPMYSDMGFAKAYSGIGVIGAILYYLSLFHLLTAPKTDSNRRNRVFLILVIIINFAIEYKEPFFMKYNLALLTLTTLLLCAMADNYKNKSTV